MCHLESTIIPFVSETHRESRRRARGTRGDARGREDDTRGYAKERSCDFSAHARATIGEESGLKNLE